MQKRKLKIFKRNSSNSLKVILEGKGITVRNRVLEVTSFQ